MSLYHDKIVKITDKIYDRHGNQVSKTFMCIQCNKLIYLENRLKYYRYAKHSDNHKIEECEVIIDINEDKFCIDQTTVTFDKILDVHVMRTLSLNNPLNIKTNWLNKLISSNTCIMCSTCIVELIPNINNVLKGVLIVKNINKTKSRNKHNRCEGCNYSNAFKKLNFDVCQFCFSTYCKKCNRFDNELGFCLNCEYVSKSCFM